MIINPCLLQHIMMLVVKDHFLLPLHYTAVEIVGIIAVPLAVPHQREVQEVLVLRVALILRHHLVVIMTTTLMMMTIEAAVVQL
jgi:hypothetical protein